MIFKFRESGLIDFCTIYWQKSKNNKKVLKWSKIKWKSNGKNMNIFKNVNLWKLWKYEKTDIQISSLLIEIALRYIQKPSLLDNEIGSGAPQQRLGSHIRYHKTQTYWVLSVNHVDPSDNHLKSVVVYISAV